MANAEFTVDGDAFANLGYDAANGDVLDLLLEDLPALDVYKCVYEVVQKSEGAPDISELGAIGSGGAQPSPTPQSALSVTMPVAGMHIYILRCQVNNGRDATGKVVASYTKERAIVIRSSGYRKIAPAESTQYDATYGWTTPVNQVIDAIALGGAAGAWREPALVANAAALPAYTRTGNVLTASANGSINSAGIDGVTTLAIGDRVLYWTGLGSSHVDYGIFAIDDLGDGSNPWVMTRVSTLDESSEVTKALTVALEGGGTTYGGHAFRLMTTGTITINTTALEFQDVGVLGALVTTTDPGLVATLGAANTVLQSNASTPGGVWRAELRLGADPPASGAIRLSNQLGMYEKLTAGDRLMIGGGLADALHVGSSSNGGDTYLEAPSGQSIVARIAAGAVATFAAALVTLAAPLAIDSQTYVGSTGDVRLPDKFSIISREDDDSADVEVMALDSAEVLMVGGTTTGPASVRFGTGAAERFAIYGTKLQSNVAGFEWHRSNVVDPEIYQSTDIATDGQGDTFTTHAQDVSGAYSATNPRGGDKVIRSGGDDSATATNVDSGDVAIHTGAQKGSGGRGDIYIGRSIAGTATERAGLVVLDSQSGHNLRVTGGNKLIVGSSGIVCYDDAFFQSAVASPSLYQDDDTTASATGETFTDHAQDCTGATSTGGDRVIRPGAGTSANGSLELQDGGGTPRITVGPTGGVTVASQTDILFTRAGNPKFSIKSTDITLYEPLEFDKTITDAAVTQEQADTGNGAAMTMQAQQGNSTDGDGGVLHLAGGLLGGTGDSGWGQLDDPSGGMVAAWGDEGLNIASALFLDNFTTASSTPHTIPSSATIVLSAYTLTAAQAITLPAQSSGQIVVIKDTDMNAAANNITLTPPTGNIDGSSSYTMVNDGESIVAQSDGTDYWIIASHMIP